MKSVEFKKKKKIGRSNNDKEILRYAKVVVSKKPKPPEPEKVPEEEKADDQEEPVETTEKNEED